MRAAVVLVVTFAAFAAPVRAAAPQTPVAVVRVPARNVFAHLFIPQRPTPDVAGPTSPWVEAPVVLTTSKTTVACGITVVSGNSSIDPSLPHAVSERAAQAAIRTIPAPPCGK